MSSEVPEYGGLISQLALGVDEIKQKWNDDFVEAANRGTRMHLGFELYLNSVDIPIDTLEVKMFLKFVGAMDSCSAYWSEWGIFGEDGNICIALFN